MATAVIQDITVSSLSENVLDYQDTSDDRDLDIESETLHRKRKRSKGQKIIDFEETLDESSVEDKSLSANETGIEINNQIDNSGFIDGKKFT
ncbi:hypothetical protein BpHYR1_037307 [Brachionus plicatilis]|uniref:Uncharacterized protein n=1 Tax=Brachionus plicatilis TaxID=10195 RepID=A0A3M7RY96_BRAPC|nr:hypothetical protein BpHYR1_037307 [Brachionus plicatilis]